MGLATERAMHARAARFLQIRWVTPGVLSVYGGGSRLRFHELRSTGLTWMAIRGDDPLNVVVS